MTIVTSVARASALATANQTTAPFVTGAGFVPVTTTGGGGTEVQAVANINTPTTYDRWVITEDGTDGVSAIFDFGASIEPSMMAIVAHNIGTVGGSVRWEYSATGGSPWTPSLAGSVTPTDNSAIAWRTTGESSRYWRIYITGVTNGDDVSVGVAWIGNEIIFPQDIYQGYSPPTTPTQVDLRNNVSEGGNLLGSAYVERGSTFSVSMDLIDVTFFRTATWLAFQRAWNRGQPAFWAWRPDDFASDIFYAWRAASSAIIRPTNSGPLAYQTIDLEGRLYHE